MKKIAFLFLIYDILNLEELWDSNQAPWKLWKD